MSARRERDDGLVGDRCADAARLARWRELVKRATSIAFVGMCAVRRVDGENARPGGDQARCNPRRRSSYKRVELAGKARRPRRVALWRAAGPTPCGPGRRTTT